MWALWAIALLLALCSCGGYRGQDVVRVGVNSDEWSAKQRTNIELELANLTQAYGITFELIEETEVESADVHLRHRANPNWLVEGWRTDYSDDVNINTENPSVVLPLKFRAVVGHEISHWLGMNHLKEDGHMLSWSAGGDVPTAFDLAEFQRATGRQPGLR